MKKLFSLLLLIGLLLQAPFSFAEKDLSRLLKALLKTPAGKLPSPALRQSLSKLPPSQLAALTAQLKQANAELARQNAQTRAFQAKLFETTRPAIFRALPPAKEPRLRTFYKVTENGKTKVHQTVALDTFTGTVFEIETDGKTEIFGVVPMHVLRDVVRTPGLLSYKFTAEVEQNGTTHKIQAHIVQLSSDKTADVALVKFKEKDRALLSPLRLAPNMPPAAATRLYMQGYACNLPVQGIATVSGYTSAGLVTTLIPAARPGERIGLCGSPLVDENMDLTGIHVGSTYTDYENPSSATMPGKDQGYMTPASYLYYLVDSYHHPGKAVVPVMLRGQEILRLAVDEYISRLALLDENYEPLRIYETQFKMTLRPVEQDLSVLPQARWMRLYIGRTHWKQNERGWYVANDDTRPQIIVAPVPANEPPSLTQTDP